MIKIFALKAKDNFSEKVRGICAQKNLYDAKNTRVFRDESVILLSNGENNQESMFRTNDCVVISDCFISNRGQLLKNYDLDPRTENNELILYLYKKKGNAFINELEGQFSILVYDVISKEIFAYTDQFGINPLYYSVQQDNDFFISSEIKAFKNLYFFRKSLNHKRVYDYLTTLTSVPELTFYDNVLKIKKGHFLQLNESHQCVSRQYYELSPGKYHFTDYEDCVNQFNEIFKKTINEYESEAKTYSSITSGGLDSTSISCVLSDIAKNDVQSYSSIFTSPNHDFSKANEDQFVREVSQQKKLNHSFIEIEDTGPFNFLLNFRNDADMPLYNTNLYVMDPILKEANLSGSNYIFDGLDGDVVISHGYDELCHLARNFKFKSFFSSIQEDMFLN